MSSKAELLLHPVRMKIVLSLMQHQEGLSTKEMVKIIQDVPQATLYRHIQVLLESDVIQVVDERKVRAVTEKYYGLNEEAARLDMDDWRNLSKEKKLNYFSYYQMVLMSQYQNYLTSLESNKTKEDMSTISLLELRLSEDQLNDFQNELNELMLKYYQASEKSSTTASTVAVTILPRI
ncbi:helix-turn-helix domain-containing protein [Sporosarcina obsidiansis]|uniref:helix-turn-helix domain-containing protein n=1 Tax=Sporosarcina obsidiansis TaxID=2660748 RepID=UPI00129B8182|nr:helix-turn-helix domain-containing protein [Sporosarcina obsidiansis]